MLWLMFVILSDSIYSAENKYNLIDATPRCYETGICSEIGRPGSIGSIYPNSEERATMLLRNIARLYPSKYRTSKYGIDIYGTYGGEWDYDGNGYCGKAAEYPFYWFSDANQLARFHEWDDGSCNQQDIGHNTCKSPDRCSRFNEDDKNPCKAKYRFQKFVEGPNGAWCKAEGIWGANMGYVDAHCSSHFEPQIWFLGIGFYPKRNSITANFVDKGPEIWKYYPLPQGAHLDERLKVNEKYYSIDNKHLQFLVEYYGKQLQNGHGDKAKKIYLLYDNNKYDMSLYMGDNLSGFFEKNFEIPTKCKPYAFVVITESNYLYRLPESQNYFFGTSWTEWEWWEPDQACEENHYFYDESKKKWIANGEPGINVKDIQSVDQNKCQGCSEINALQQIYYSLLANSNTMDNNINDNSTTIITTNPNKNSDSDDYNNDEFYSLHLTNRNNPYTIYHPYEIFAIIFIACVIILLIALLIHYLWQNNCCAKCQTKMNNIPMIKIYALPPLYKYFSDRQSNNNDNNNNNNHSTKTKGKYSNPNIKTIDIESQTRTKNPNISDKPSIKLFSYFMPNNQDNNNNNNNNAKKSEKQQLNKNSNQNIDENSSWTFASAMAMFGWYNNNNDNQPQNQKQRKPPPPPKH